MKRPDWKHLVFLGSAILLVLVGITALFIIKERRTLERLLHPERVPPATAIYTHWLELDPTRSCTFVRTTRWLEMLGYQRVDGYPTQPGQYRTSGSDISVFARSFRYPHGAYPAQLMDLTYSNGQLTGIKAVAGQAQLLSWRLEPKILAEWNVASRASPLQVRITDLPPHVPRAVLAMEDKRFYEHGAFDFIGIARAILVDIRHLEFRQGASTITQQLARSIFLDIQRTLRRKILESIMALYLQMRYTKPQLLEMYLNQVYWGQDGPNTLVGMEAASRSFFGKSARFLTLGESAMLAGMLQSPARYSPRREMARAEDRKKIVLGLMKDQKVITEDQYQAALAEKINLAPPAQANDSAYFLSMLRGELGRRYELSALLTQGWLIYTTLDPLLQKDAVASIPSPKTLSPGRGKGEGPQAALVTLNPRTGAILAWVGGTNFQTNPFDHAMDAKRQPGSAFKPFVILAALESQKATAATLLEDAPLTLKGLNGSWTPQNYDQKYLGRVSVWDALVLSRNVPIVRLAKEVGIGAVVQVARRAGIESDLREDLSLALGSSEVSLLELTNAYATLAARGIRTTPYSIDAVVDPSGQILEQAQPAVDEVFAPPLIYLVTQMLEAVLEVGTGKSSRVLGWDQPSAGKTGTSENYQDAWFMGYTSELVCGVWVGHDRPQSLGRSAAGIALPIWVEFMKRAALLEPPKKFEEPAGLVWKSIDSESGFLSKTGCVNRRKIAFLSGTEPTEDCPLHAGGIKGLFKRWRAKT